MTAVGERLGGEEMDLKGKRTHRHEQQCGDCNMKACIRGLNGIGKKYSKD